MIKRMLSFMVILTAGYMIFQNRYRLMNLVLGNPAVRNLAVGTLMSFPMARKWIIHTIFLPQAANQP